MMFIMISIVPAEFFKTFSGLVFQKGCGIMTAKRIFHIMLPFLNNVTKPGSHDTLMRRTIRRMAPVPMRYEPIPACSRWFIPAKRIIHIMLPFLNNVTKPGSHYTLMRRTIRHMAPVPMRYEPIPACSRWFIPAKRIIHIMLPFLNNVTKSGSHYTLMRRTIRRMAPVPMRYEPIPACSRWFIPAKRIIHIMLPFLNNVTKPGSHDTLITNLVPTTQSFGLKHLKAMPALLRRWVSYCGMTHCPGKFPFKILLAAAPIYGTGHLAMENSHGLSFIETELKTLNKFFDQFMDWISKMGPRLLSAVIILAIGLVLIKFIIKLFNRFLNKSRIEKSVHAFARSVVKIALYTLLFVIILETLNIPVAPLITMLGAAGLAVSLVLKDSVANPAGGILVLVSKPFAVGDYIEMDGFSGTVAEIGIFYTILKTIDNKRIYLPNADVAKAKIINFSAEPMRRLDLTFSIGYQDSIPQAKEILRNLVEASPLVLKEPEPVIGVCAHGSNAIQITCRVWVPSEHYWDLNFDLLEKSKQAFDQAGISIPYNQMDLHIIPADATAPQTDSMEKN